ncbi:MAG: prolyl aminopeptidase [Methylococcaceae bacterium]|nr:prolyl aminopeptidase [Methylococcaceae bacterium]
MTQFFLNTGSVHQVYIEQSGNPAGIPVIFLHGGPCSGTKPDHRRFFNPALYHIVLMDQRGCGQSLPFGELVDNHTQGLIADIEQLRQQLRVEQWLLFGGSWGSTLALLYAQQYPQQVMGMILRGSFLARQADMDWFLNADNGVSRIYPQRWQALLESLPTSQANILERLCEAVFSDSSSQIENAVREWQNWGGQVALGNAYQQQDLAVTERDILQVRMELHYARNHYFIAENQILEHCAVLQDIPTIIIHGQQDLTCPLEASWQLHQALPQAELIILPNAGHIAKGEEMIDALVDATDRLAITL